MYDVVGAYYMTVPKLIDDVDDADNDLLPHNRVGTFRNYFRMDRSNFKILLDKVAPIIEKQDTNFRLAIPAEERLMLTLRFLATGKRVKRVLSRL